MKNVQGWIGLIVMILSIPLGLYVGGWLMFIGGIVQTIEAIKSTPVEAMDIALGIARVVAASFVGVVTFWLNIAIGYGLVASSK